jgi:hypothetical protein
LATGLFVLPAVYAQSCDARCSGLDECRDKIAKCQEAWNMMENAKNHTLMLFTKWNQISLLLLNSTNAREGMGNNYHCNGNID